MPWESTGVSVIYYKFITCFESHKCIDKVKSDRCYALIRLESRCHVRSQTYRFILQNDYCSTLL